MGLLDKYFLNSVKSILKLHFVIKKDLKMFRPIRDFWEDQILLEKTLSDTALDAGQAN